MHYTKEVIAMDPKKIITLCPACGACPTVEFYDETVRIGEEGNRVTLKKAEWNDLVDMIRRGDLNGI
jgi:hypothetical protein